MHVFDVVELHEFKHSYLPVKRERSSELPHAAAQVIGSLHFLATARVIKSINDE